MTARESDWTLEADEFEVTMRGELADVRLVIGGELRFTVRRRNR